MISEAEILAKLQQYLRSSSGKALLKEHGITHFNTSAEITPEMIEQMKIMGERMADLMYERIVAVIPSFTRDAIVIGQPYRKGKAYALDIDFDYTKVHRESLWPEGYPEGLKNIVRLFSTGVHAKGQVYGVWEGHSVEPITSKPVRRPRNFLVQAVEDFNKAFKTLATATLNESYQHR